MRDLDPTLPASASAAAPAPGARIGRFETIGPIGSGGMGVVIEARDPELDRRVAIKLLHPSMWPGESGPAGRSRLQREAQAMAKLSHPNVVAVYEVGRIGDQTFIAMERVEGDTLRRWLEARRPWPEVVAMFVAAGRGLAAAHAAGLVHRDFKPDNVLVGPDGRPRVTDFGLATGETSPPRDGVAGAALLASLTVDGKALGTPAYMSPEHWAGDRVDARSDQFSFCIALWEGIHGVRPFAAPTPQAVRAKVSAGVLDPPPETSRIPDWLDAVIRRGLAHDPAARWADLPALLAALEAGAPARPPVPSRAPWAAIGLSTAAAAALAGFALTRDPPSPSPPASRLAAAASPAALTIAPTGIARLTFGAGCDQGPTLSSDGAAIYYDATVGGANHLFRIDLAGGTPRELTTTDGYDLFPRASPDGKRIAFTRFTAEQNMMLMVAELDRLAAARPIAVSAGQPFWSPDGAHVWGGFEDGLVRYDAATGAPGRRLAPYPDHVAHAGVELPDGSVVIAASPLDGSALVDRIVRFPAAGGAPEVLLEAPLWGTFAVLPSGDAVVVAQRMDNHSVQLHRVPFDGGPVTTLTQGAIPARNHLAIAGLRLVWSDCMPRTSIASVDATGFTDLAHTDWGDWDPTAIPGGTGYYFLSDRTGTFTIHRAELARPEAATALPIAGFSPGELAVSPDGATIAFVDRRRGLHLVPAAEVAAGAAASPRLLVDERVTVSPSFDRTGARLYFTHFEDTAPAVSVVDVAGGAPRRLPIAAGRAPAASPTADVVAFLLETAEGNVPALYDVVTRKVRTLVRPERPDEGWSYVRWSPDGARLLLVAESREVRELDAATGAELRRFSVGGDNLSGATYVGDAILVGRNRWSGNLWTAMLAAPLE